MATHQQTKHETTFNNINKDTGLVAIIRLRGTVNVRPDVNDTLRMLRLVRKYHLVIYSKDTPGLQGMLQKAKDWITWGEIDRSTLIELLRHRGRAPGNRKLTDEYLRENLGVNSIEELVDKIIMGQIKLNKCQKIKPVFRLHPPQGGFKKSLRRQYNNGGELGYRGPAINELIKRML